MHVSRIALVATMLSVGSVPVIAEPTPPAAKAPSPQTHGNPHATTPTTHGSPKAATIPPTHGQNKATAPAPTTTTTAPRLNPIAQKISSNHGLQPKVKALLPAGMTLNQASLGFKNQGQFLAALHVSRNLGIPFGDLKTAMTGIRPTSTGATGGTTTGTPTTSSPATLSLGQAIQKLRPSANTEAAATTAEHQATADLNATVTVTSTATPKKKGK